MSFISSNDSTTTDNSHDENNPSPSPSPRVVFALDPIQEIINNNTIRAVVELNDIHNQAMNPNDDGTETETDHSVSGGGGDEGVNDENEVGEQPLNDDEIAFGLALREGNNNNNDGDEVEQQQPVNNNNDGDEVEQQQPAMNNDEDEVEQQQPAINNNDHVENIPRPPSSHNSDVTTSFGSDTTAVSLDSVNSRNNVVEVVRRRNTNARDISPRRIVINNAVNRINDRVAAAVAMNGRDRNLPNPPDPNGANRARNRNVPIRIIVNLSICDKIALCLLFLVLLSIVYIFWTVHFILLRLQKLQETMSGELEQIRRADRWGGFG